MVSRFRPGNTILAATPHEKTYRQLAMSWGVMPVLTPVYNTTDEMFGIANNFVKHLNLAKQDDAIVVTCGTPKVPGCTNLIKIEFVR
jgi:pyruvate kinase